MKRWLVQLCAFVILGAIVNVAVAIVAAAEQPRLHILPDSCDNSFEQWTAIEPSQSDREWLAARGWQPTERSEISEYSLRGWTIREGSVICRVVGEQSRFAPADSHVTYAGSSVQYSRPALREVVAGWPTAALMGRIWNAASFGDTLRGKDDWRPQRLLVVAERFPDPLYRSMMYSAWVLPALPILPGFAINMVFYAALLWLLFAAPFALRRWRRIKRGLCPKCAYDLRGSGKDSTACPECGATR